MNLYKFYFSIDTEIKAESIDEVWEIVKRRMADRFYGPTSANLEFLEEITEELSPGAAEL